MKHPEVLQEVFDKWGEWIEMMNKEDSNNFVFDILCTEIYKERNKSEFYKKMWDRSSTGVKK